MPNAFFFQWQLMPNISQANIKEKGALPSAYNTLFCKYFHKVYVKWIFMPNTGQANKKREQNSWQTQVKRT